MTKSARSLQTLAIWLCGAALRTENGFTTLRNIVKQAAVDAAEIYSSKGEENELEPTDPYDVRSIITMFASFLDEDKRSREEDE